MQDEIICSDCSGTRLNKDAFHWSIDDFALGDFLLSNIERTKEKIEKLINGAKHNREVIKTLRQLKVKLEVALDLDLGHLNLHQKAKKLSPSEYQRLLLVKYFSNEESGSLFVFDEPTLGLGLNEQKKVLKYLRKLRNQGNTIVVVDHSEFLHKNCDQLLVMGPGAGEHGGKVVHQGCFQKSKIQTYKPQKISSKKSFKFKKCEITDSRKLNFNFAESSINWVYGASSSGKTKAILNGVANGLLLKLKKNDEVVGEIAEIDFVDYPSNLTDVQIFTATSLSSNSRSSVGSFTGLGAFLRKVYSRLPISREMLLQDGHFSSNSNLGQCPTCEGRGKIIVDMKFLEDVEYRCPDCNGMKLRPMYASITRGAVSFYDALQMPIEEVFSEIKKTPKIVRTLELLRLLNLDHLNLDRSLSSLSGGEKQRLKLLKYLLEQPKNSLLVFENLSFGLSTLEVAKICEYLEKILVENNTIIILDPNPVFNKFAHYSLEFQTVGNPVLTALT
jgi:excinuclease ABC subunit A